LHRFRRPLTRDECTSNPSNTNSRATNASPTHRIPVHESRPASTLFQPSCSFPYMGILDSPALDSFLLPPAIALHRPATSRTVFTKTPTAESSGVPAA